jgi:LCP family protein required for cell wall assembly
MRPHGIALLGKAGYALSCIIASVVLVVAGVGYYAQSKIGGIGNSNVLAGGPSTGPMNILVMGLESRTYWSGKPLPKSLEDIMHIGHSGGNATNTLILIHIFDGGQKAVGFSIPRDDYVQMYGTPSVGFPSMSKIDNAYGYAMAAKISQLAQTNPSMPSWQKNFYGNEAGRLAAVETVEHLTGQHIDHLAELNLDGFYQIAQAFHGIAVCVKKWPGGGGLAPGANLTDANSGANLRVGYQHLDAAQSLSFVRERDNLPGGDLDRTARQQAALDYVLWDLKHEGLFSDVGRLSSLLSFAGNYLITSKGWNLLQFAGEMDSLSGHNLTFHTLPITGNENVPGIGDVNTVDPATLAGQVSAAFSQPPGGTTSGNGSSGSSGKASGKPTVPPPAPSTVTVDVYNGGNTSGLAGLVSKALVAKGYHAGAVQTASVKQQLTTVSYGAGASANAALIAKDFGVTATLSSSVAAEHVQVTLGADATTVPAALGGTSTAGSTSSGSSPSPTATSTTPSYTTQNGSAINVSANAKYGIPCVY